MVSMPKKRRYKYRSGTVALRQIRKYQRTVNLLLPTTSFQRLVRHIMSSVSCIWNITRMGVEALQEAAAHYLVERFQRANVACIHAKRITLKMEDMRVAETIID